MRVIENERKRSVRCGVVGVGVVWVLILELVLDSSL